MAISENIEVYKFYNSRSLSSREQADIFFSFYFKLKVVNHLIINDLHNDLWTKHHFETIIIDFSNIDFASRSFIDQFIKHQEKLTNNSNLKFEIKNAIPVIKDSFSLISNTQTDKLVNLSANSISYSKHTTILSLYNYLNSIDKVVLNAQ